MKIIKKPVSILLALMMMVGLFSIVPITVSAATENLGGYNFTVETDDEGSYYKIDCADALCALSSYVNAAESNDCSGRRFKQTADINMAGRNWEPIGKDDSMRYFKGAYDGDGYFILNITHTAAGQYDISGLFGDFRGTVKNVNLKDCNFTGNRAAGIAASTYNNSSIENCSVLGGTITGTDMDPNVRHGSYIAGIAGYFYSGTVSDCFVDTTYGGNAFDKGPVVGWSWGTVTDSCYTNMPDGATNDDGDQVTGGYITLDDGITMSGNCRTFGRTEKNTYRFAEQGEEITLGYDNVPAGYKAVYHSDDVTITDGVFTMPEKDVSVTADIEIDPAHFSQDDANTYTIHTAEGWELFCECLKNTNEYNRFSGKTVKLGADITVSTMAGSDSCDFCGTFDGDKHTLTFNYGKSESYAEVEYIAPFCYVSTVTPAGGDEIPAKIENLHVDGDIYTSKKYAAGLVAQHWGTLTIENCRSSVNIHSKVSGDGSHGGFEAVNRGALTIKGCVFDGKLLSDSGTTDCGGFIGWRNSTAAIYNSLFAPEQVTVGTDGSATFARNKVDTFNCYYTNAFYNSGHDPSYAPYDPQDAVYPDKYNNGKQGYTITADDGITVDYGTAKITYDVSGVTVYENNTGLKCGDKYYAEENAAVTLTPSYTGTPATGYDFTEFTISAGTYDDGVLTMPAGNVNIGAVYDMADYRIVIPDFEHGSVTASVDGEPAATAHYNDVVTLTLTPDTGYNGMYVWINGDEIYPEDGVFSFRMPAQNALVNVYFDPITYHISFADMENGSVSVSDDSVHYYDNITLDVAPNEGYEVRYVKYNDTLIRPQNGVYSFRMPPEDVTISAVFEVPKDPVSFLDENGKQQSVTVYDIFDGTEDTLETGWYVLSGDMDYSDRLTVSGDVFLILCDDCTLNANDGIDVSKGSSLTIYAQSDGDDAGVLNAFASGQDYDAAGIGGSNNSAGTITINGGNIKAQGCFNGAGIGGGNGSGGNITINGGIVRSEGGYNGDNGISGTITLGYTRAMDSVYASSYKGTVKIADGKTFTDGTPNTYTSETPSATLTALTDTTLIPADALTITVGDCEHGTVSAPKKAFANDSVTVDIIPDEGYALKNVKYNDNVIRLNDGAYTFAMPDEDVEITATFLAPKDPVAYLDENGEQQSAVYYDVLSGEVHTIESGWYVLSATREFPGRVTVSGDVHLILCDGCTFNANNGGIRLTQYDSLTIYAQSTGGNRGVLTAKAVAEKYAGIGGNYCENGGTVTINGGDVTAAGAYYGAGIGGGSLASGGTFIMNGGKVKATSVYYGAGIGGGYEGYGSNVTINGGEVNATGGGYGAGIGGGADRDGSNITINGGKVKAIAGEQAAGLGGGFDGNSGKITINGGDITVIGGDAGSGIGGGYTRDGDEIIINGGTVSVTVTGEGAAIGGAKYGAGGNITINGGKVSATGDKGPGIGGVTDNDGCTITLGYTDGADHIYASSYIGTVTIADGKAFTDGTDIYNSETPSDTLEALTDTMLIPYDGFGARLAGHTLSLDGDIGVNFYMTLSDAIAQSETTYMQFTIPTGDKTETKTVLVSEAEQKGCYYVFKCNVAAKEMTSPIKAQMFDPDNEQSGIVYSYSVKEYADYLLAHTDDNWRYAKAAPLVTAMLNYGDGAQIYFDKTSTGLANADLSDEDKTLGEITDQLDAWAEIDNDITGTVFDGATLSLKSQTTLSLYFTDTDELTFTCVDENKTVRTVETVRKGSTQIARIRNIAASELQYNFTLTVAKGDTELGTVIYSPMNYCYKVLHGSTDNESLKNVVKALYWYSEAANDYFYENIVDLGELTGDYEAKNGDILTGTLEGNKQITIAEGAFVTLRDADITCLQNDSIWADFAGITPLGDATVILEGTNVVKGGYEDNPAILVPVNHTLTIVGDGSLDVSTNGFGCCGIGGRYNGNAGSIVIKGGDITAYAGNNCAAIGSSCSGVCGDITISGGNVTAYGGHSGAGIGSGVGHSAACGVITISGGTVTAEGGTNAAGIGCGEGAHCSEIIISGGDVIACGGYAAAGIGSGYKSDYGSECGDITISGGTVYAEGGDFGAGIGSGAGSEENCGTITITGGEVEARGGYEGAGIGSGEGANCTKIIISGGTVYAEGGNYAAGIGSGGQEGDIGATCGDITITAGVTQVTAKKGRSEEWIDSIGRGYEGFCGTVMIEPGANVIQY